MVKSFNEKIENIEASVRYAQEASDTFSTEALSEIFLNITDCLRDLNNWLDTHDTGYNHNYVIGG